MVADGSTRGPFFDVYGPYNFVAKDRMCTGSQKEFWKEVGLPELAKAVGCYMFCLESRGRTKPWYVGQTKAKAGFKGEIFQKHKTDIYTDCLRDYAGKPKMFFFPLAIKEPSYRFSHNTSAHGRAIDWLEITLMGFAHKRNPRISNVKDMYFLRNVEVRGVLGRRPGRPHREVYDIRHVLFGEA